MQRVRNTTSTLVLTALVAALAACGGGGPGDASTSDDNEILVVDNDFEPDNLEVTVGDEVTWVWDGNVPHDVSGDGFASEVQDSGTFSHTFDEPGEHDYTCTLHRGMDGRITVVEA